MSLDVKKITNRFLKSHLAYVEHTEAPVLFHIWAAIGSIAACMERHLYLETGIGKIFGNQYVILVGPPATKKSFAIKSATHLAVLNTDIRIAPDDTGGQRQGLIASMEEFDIESTAEEVADNLDIESQIEKLNSTTVNVKRSINNHVISAIALELGSLLGQNNVDLMRYLIRTWDGDDYTYQLKQTKHTIHKPLMTIIGGTTPADIAVMLPPAAIGQGCMSRMILVYEPYREKSVPPSQMHYVKEYENYLASVYINVNKKMQGAINMTSAAKQTVDRLYATETKIEDTRFIYYSERRSMHLLKLAMALTVARDSMTMEETDILEAEYILSYTEKRMPEALGEYGLSPIAVSQQKMLDYLRYAKEPVSEKILWAIMQRDMRGVDFSNALGALVNADKVKRIMIDQPNEDGSFSKRAAYIYRDSVSKLVETMDDDSLDVLIAGGAKDLNKRQIN